MTLNLDTRALSGDVAKAMAGLSKDLVAAFDRTEAELGLNDQLERSVAVTGNTCTFEWTAKNKSPSAVQLHEGAVINGTRIDRHPWLSDALDRIDLAKNFSEHYD